MFWHARRRFPYNTYAHNQLGHALLRRGEDAAALAAYAEAARRFPKDPVALVGYGHALLELSGPDAALPVPGSAVIAHPTDLPLCNVYTEALIQSGDLPEAGRRLVIARRLAAQQRDHNPKIDELVRLLDLARFGKLQPRHRQAPPEGQDGDPDTLADIAGRGLIQAPALGESTLFRQAGKHDLARAAIKRLSAGPERDVEEGLLIAANDGWTDAAQWWGARETYESVTRIHAQRSRGRAGEAMDWAPLLRDLPQFEPIIQLRRGTSQANPGRSARALPRLMRIACTAAAWVTDNLPANGDAPRRRGRHRPGRSAHLTRLENPMRSTTKTLTAIALGIGLAMGGGAAWCGPGEHDPAENVARMTKQLHLTPEQQTQVRTILDEQRAAAERLRADTRKRIDAVLTDAQRTELNAQITKGLDRHVQRMTKDLGLNAEQASRIRAILAERQANPDLNRTALRERIAAVLTPEQLQQYDSMRSHGPRPAGKEKKQGPADESPAGGPPDESMDESGSER